VIIVMETDFKEGNSKDKGFLFQKAFMCGIGSCIWWNV